MPPLQYDQAAELKRDFPEAVVVLNGGLSDVSHCAQAWETFDGVMLGRAAWHDPAVLVRLSKYLQHRSDDIDESQLIDVLVQYADSQMRQGVPLRVLVRPLLGLWQGRNGARRWRRALSDAASLHLSEATLIRRAWQSVGPVNP